MWVARAKLQREAAGVLVRQKPPQNRSAPLSSPGRRHFGRDHQPADDADLRALPM
jgi:hypothetical protein